MLKYLDSFEDIQLMVNQFYSKIRKDDLLRDIFNNVIQDQWDKHLEKMYRFWQTVLLNEHTYWGSPFLPHAKLPIQKEHFDRWLNLFFETVDENFYGHIAEKAKWQGERMAQTFLYKLEYYNHKDIS